MSDPPLVGRLSTFPDAMKAAAEQFGDVEAYVEGTRRLTYSDWLTAADGVAAAMARRGVRPGDVVAIMIPSSIDYAVALAGAIRAGAVATGLNVRLGPREVQAICGRCRPTLAVIPRGPRPEGLPTAATTMDVEELAAAGSRPGLGPHRPEVHPGDAAVIVWTSGTTGLPKGAWFDHDNLRAAVTSAGIMTAPFDRRLVSTPFAHAGYMAKLWEQLAWATTLVICPTPWRAADMLRLLAVERITVAGGAPAQWEKLLEQANLDQADLSALRLGVAATAPTPPDLVRRVVDRCGCPLIVRYAMTESPSITGTDPGDPPEVLYRTVGRTQAGMEISIRSEEGTPLLAGSIGRIHVRGGCVMRGYWGEPDLTAAVLDADGWLRSSDVGHIDGDGNLVLAGRVDDLYIRGGYKVHPLEVENVLAEHPGVAQVAVIGVPAPVLGEIGVAFVVPAEGTPPDASELRHWLKARLADYKAPDRIEFASALPLTSMMKVDKDALRRLAAIGAQPPAEEATSSVHRRD